MTHGSPSVIHICDAGAFVALDGGCLTVRCGGGTSITHPLGWVGMLCLHHRSITVSGSALAKLTASGVPIAWFTGGGRLLHRIVPPWSNDIGKRVRQLRAFDDPQASLAIVRRLVARKAQAQAAYLAERLRRSERSTRGLAALRDRVLAAVAVAPDAATLRGIEGRLARLYFRSIARTLPEALRFTARCRPADGVVNAGLNLLYSQLTWRMDAYLQAHGFDPGLGLLHRWSPTSTSAWGRPHLACDLVDALRPDLVDAFWFPALGRRRWREDDVLPDPELGHRFTDAARAELLLAWEAHWQAAQGWRRVAEEVDGWWQDVQARTGAHGAELAGSPAPSTPAPRRTQGLDAAAAGRE